MDTSPRKILVAEDDPSTQKLMHALLQRSGFATTVVATAPDAIEQLRTTKFAAVVLDLMMRATDGRSVIAFLAEQEAPPPVIVCTALSPAQVGTLDERVVRALIRKPFDIELLLSTVQQLAGVEEAPRAQVLIVDDDMSFRYVMRAFIDRLDAFEAESGEEALETMRSRKPDVVLLDLNLPGISGEEVLERISNDPLTRDTPVVVVTSRPLDESERRALLGRVAGIMDKRDLSRATLNGVVSAALAAARERSR